MAILVEREGIDSCISRIESAIEAMHGAASDIEKAMGELPTYWQGAAYDSAAATYADEYQTLLTKTVPESVEQFKGFINGCKDSIIATDSELAGK